MRTLTFLSTVLVASSISVTARAADLTKVDRTIVKEPAYKGQPKYCLLVFGADAQYRAWLVIDTESLYVDRNGSGDLTDADKRVPLKKVFTQAGDLTFADGKARYTNLTIERRRWWTIEVSGKNLQRASRDAEGPFAFAERSKDAPIIHFDGPLAMEVVSYCKPVAPGLVRDGKFSFLPGSIGTPGLGKGTFAYLVPPKGVEVLKPLAEIAFAHRDPKEKPIAVSVRLDIVDKGCVSFEAALRVPAQAAGSKAKVTLSFADWKEGNVASRTCEVPINDTKPPAKK